ncbi:MAG: nucleoside-diphosphate-sugar epimerase [Bacteroidia bacterium]|jgi:nucleoside-diphosphate-sugar epimerase
MKSRSVLIVGCGDLGIRCGTHLAQQGCEVIGVRRNLDKLPPAFAGIAANYTESGSLAFLADQQPDFLVAIFNPTDRSEQGYKVGFTRAMDHLLDGLGDHRPAHIFMTSSTRVFDESEGGWVDEDSPLTQSDPWARSIIAAEERLLQSGHKASVIRFAGIYGIPGGRLLSRIRRGELCPPSPVSYTNRIHREDAGAFLAHLVERAAAAEALRPIYIGVDDLPAPRYEVESWLAHQMGLEPDPLAGVAEAEPIRNNSAGHKRCSNAALRDSGYKLIYSDYRQGYRELLDAG